MAAAGCRQAILIVLVVALCEICGSEARRGGGSRRGKELFNKAVNETGTNRQGKLFSLFNVVQFNNDPCASTSTNNGVNRNGTCYTSTECDDRGGNAEGNCAAGFGVCCIFTVDGTNGRTTVDNNCTYIQNEGYPSAITAASTHTFTVNKCNDDVCYLRLDFETFTMLGTSGSGNANEGDCTDTFTVTTQTGMTVPTLCGENSGKHIYVDIGANSGDTATIAFTTTATASNRIWDIKVSQIECNNPNAPRDSCCLQYHTGCTGRLMSFNYDNTNDNHLNNQQYQICIRQECGFCCVEYQICQDQLTLVGGSPAGWSFDTVPVSSKNDPSCQSNDNSIDFIAITGSGSTCSPSGGGCDRAINGRYCGQNLNSNTGVTTNAPICDCTAPFTVDVWFNNLADGAAVRAATKVNAEQSRGFCLDYRQVPC